MKLIIQSRISCQTALLLKPAWTLSLFSSEIQGSQGPTSYDYITISTLLDGGPQPKHKHLAHLSATPK